MHHRLGSGAGGTGEFRNQQPGTALGSDQLQILQQLVSQSMNQSIASQPGHDGLRSTDNLGAPSTQIGTVSGNKQKNDNAESEF